MAAQMFSHSGFRNGSQMQADVLQPQPPAHPKPAAPAPVPLAVSNLNSPTRGFHRVFRINAIDAKGFTRLVSVRTGLCHTILFTFLPVLVMPRLDTGSEIAL